MKKIILSVILLTCSLFANQTLYSTVVKPVYLNETTDVVAGKLLPTNGIEVLQTTNKRIKFSIKGYQNPDVANVIYYSDGQRILALAFAKTKAPKFELIKKGENGSWNEVRVVAYTNDGNFTDNLNLLFEKAKKQYQDSCSICHAMHQPTHYSANQWPALIKSMISRTPIDKKDEWTITQYLQKHSKDIQKQGANNENR